MTHAAESLAHLYASYAADDAFHCRSHKWQYVLAAVTGDHLAQILSFTAGVAHFTVAAVSPTARLYAEFIVCDANSTNLLLDLSHGGPMHALQYASYRLCPRLSLPLLPAFSEFRKVQPIERVAWWVRKCALPVKAADTAALRELVASPLAGAMLPLEVVHLDQPASHLDVARARVVPLREVAAPEPPPFMRSVEAAALVNLRALRLSSWTRGSITFASTLPRLAQLHLRGVAVPELDVGAMAAAPHLTHLSLPNAALRTLAGLDRCTSLTRVDVSDCHRLEELAALSAVPSLQHVVARRSAVRCLGGLALCPDLEYVDVGWCAALHDVAALAGAPRLLSLVADHSGLRRLQGLHANPRLVRLDVTGCGLLHTLAPLAGAPRLRELIAAHSAVRDVDGLADCRCLELLDVSHCRRLSSLLRLSGAPRLRVVRAAGSAVRDLDGLEKCPLLEEVDVTECDRLRCLAVSDGAMPRFRGCTAWGRAGDCECPGESPALGLVELRGDEQPSGPSGLARATQP